MGLLCKMVDFLFLISFLIIPVGVEETGFSPGSQTL